VLLEGRDDAEVPSGQTHADLVEPQLADAARSGGSRHAEGMTVDPLIGWIGSIRAGSTGVEGESIGRAIG